jgi:glycosyltransferase involved in cell wall biosynthesis
MLRQIQRDFDAAIAARTIVARHGVDLRLWNPGDRGGGEHQEEGPIRVVAVGRLHPSKGHQDLLRATALLVASGCSLRVEIAGGGPYAAELEALIASLGLTGVASLLGPMSEEAIRDLLGTGDIFVVASHAEALGVVYMEAMALGLPVVGTTTDGALEVVEHGVCGLLVPPGNVEALAAAIEELAENPKRRRAFGLCGRQRAEALFDSRIGAGIVSREIAAILSAET